jgi:hypothetical protein
LRQTFLDEAFAPAQVAAPSSFRDVDWTKIELPTRLELLPFDNLVVYPTTDMQIMFSDPTARLVVKVSCVLHTGSLSLSLSLSH